MNIINPVNHNSHRRCTELPVPAEEPHCAPSPSGTSTGLQLRAGLHSPSSGSVFGCHRRGPHPSSGQGSSQRQHNTASLSLSSSCNSKASLPQEGCVTPQQVHPSLGKGTYPSWSNTSKNQDNSLTQDVFPLFFLLHTLHNNMVSTQLCLHHHPKHSTYYWRAAGAAGSQRRWAVVLQELPPVSINTSKCSKT